MTTCTNQCWLLIRPIDNTIYLASYSLTFTAQLGAFEFKKTSVLEKGALIRMHVSFKPLILVRVMWGKVHVLL